MLFQHGKDFEAIQNNIALKYKKKSKPANMVKNKEQVRHFYYRTWHKISKYIDFDNGEHTVRFGSAVGTTRLYYIVYKQLVESGRVGEPTKVMYLCMVFMLKLRRLHPG